MLIPTYENDPEGVWHEGLGMWMKDVILRPDPIPDLSRDPRFGVSQPIPPGGPVPAPEPPDDLAGDWSAFGNAARGTVAGLTVMRDGLAGISTAAQKIQARLVVSADTEIVVTRQVTRTLTAQQLADELGITVADLAPIVNGWDNINRYSEAEDVLEEGTWGQVSVRRS